MTNKIGKVVISLSSLLVVSYCYVTVSPIGIQPAMAQAKKKPAKKPSVQIKRTGPNLNTAETIGFLGRLRDKLDQNWNIADGRHQVTITATVNADGSTSEVSASSSPASPEAEQAANEAFAKAQPLESLPKSAGNSAKLTVTFDSVADPHGDTNRNISTKLDPIVSSTPQN